MPETPIPHQGIAGNCNAQADHGSTAIVNVYENVRPGPIDEKTLVEAERRLAALPLAYLLDHVALPAGSRMPFSCNPYFVGRQDDLISLAQTLKAGSSAGSGHIAAITGLGGIGKTQLACEFVHHYGSYFTGGVFWLSFADPESIAAEVAQCGGHGYLDLRPDFASLPLPDQVRLVLAVWHTPLPRLLIFDNCEEEELLNQWRPPSGGCRVLVTSRRSSWNPLLAVQPLPLRLLTRQESIALLLKHRPDLSEAEADAIAKELGDLPLALTLAGSFLFHYRNAITPAAYLSQLQNRSLLNHPSLQGRGASWSPTAHELHVGRTFALSYDRLKRTNPTDSLALALLARMACLAPGEPVPRDLLLATQGLSEEDSEAVLTAEDALARLTGLGLVEEEARGALTLHRLLQQFVFQLDPDPQARVAVEAALLSKSIRLNDTGDPRHLLPLQPHLRAVIAAAWTREDERVAELCNEFGFHLRMIGNYSTARPYYEWSLAVWEKTLGNEHPHTAKVLNNLGGLLQDMGDFNGARPYFERALAIWEQTLGNEHPDTATGLSNLGVLLQAMGDLNGAKLYLKRSLAIREQTLGNEHPDTARAHNNLGYLLQDTGDLAGARPYYERALAIWEKVLGDKHPLTALSFNNLGSLLRDMGDFDRARPYMVRALAIREETLGDEHPDTATSLNNLGIVLQDMRDFNGARPYLERALAIKEKVLGPEHPQMARGLSNLGLLLRDMGDLDGARPYLERSLTIREKVLGEEHPDTALSIWYIGVIHWQSGNMESARAYLRKAVGIFTRSLGQNHPTSKRCQQMLDRLPVS